MANVWQVTAGEDGREYTALVVAHDVMAVGPSRPGAWDRGRYAEVVAAGRLKESALRKIESLIGRVAAGDAVVLRRGGTAVAIGVVGDDGYRHDPGFDDMFGADVGHTRTVVWQDALTDALAELQATEPLFAAPGILGPFSRVRDTPTLLRLAPLIERCVPRAPRARPAAPRVLTPAELGQALADRGQADPGRVVTAIERQRRLLGWYAATGETAGRPHESEVVAYTIAPLLLALGWSEEQVAIGCLRIPLTVFAGAPNTAENCLLVAEGRELRFQLGDPREFPARRIRDGKLDACQLLLVARGGQFFVYRRDADGGWPDAPAGYLDVERLLTETALPAMDAVATLMALAPATVLAEWAGRVSAAQGDAAEESTATARASEAVTGDAASAGATAGGEASAGPVKPGGEAEAAS